MMVEPRDVIMGYAFAAIFLLFIVFVIMIALHPALRLKRRTARIDRCRDHVMRLVGQRDLNYWCPQNQDGFQYMGQWGELRTFSCSRCGKIDHEVTDLRNPAPDEYWAYMEFEEAPAGARLLAPKLLTS
jgi:hypothetical protein